MKTFIYFIATCFLATGIYFGSLNGSQPAIGIILALLLWAWFVWGYDVRSKKGATRKNRDLNF
ncbi:MAG: hypothetical protein JKY70_06740 [Mucilaginibacter sp.]|nr:hypothetical protein [Mucilaginibacter sp.]